MFFKFMKEIMSEAMKNPTASITIFRIVQIFFDTCHQNGKVFNFDDGEISDQENINSQTVS